MTERNYFHNSFHVFNATMDVVVVVIFSSVCSRVLIVLLFVWNHPQESFFVIQEKKPRLLFIRPAFKHM